MVDISNLESMLESGQDNALLRFTLGSAFLKHKKYDQAIEHLAVAVEMDPDYSAAWKAYGKALMEAGRPEKAAEVYTNGLEVARRKGDKQAEKEMNVFLKRIKK